MDTRYGNRSAKAIRAARQSACGKGFALRNVSRFVIAPLLVLGAFAQKASAPRHEECGHECRCVRRTFKVQQEHAGVCASQFPNRQTDKGERQAWMACMATQPQHCDIVKDRTGKYPHPYLPCEPSDNCGISVDLETSEVTGTGQMDVRCTSACKMHDCKCDDGPSCQNVP
jgi:hypothetical protein